MLDNIGLCNSCISMNLSTLLKVIERKGLDMVRRDWSLLSKELGDFCLSQILSGGYTLCTDCLCAIIFIVVRCDLRLCQTYGVSFGRSCEDVVESIHDSLVKVIF